MITNSPLPLAEVERLMQAEAKKCQRAEFHNTSEAARQRRVRGSRAGRKKIEKAIGDYWRDEDMDFNPFHDSW